MSAVSTEQCAAGLVEYPRSQRDAGKLPEVLKNFAKHYKTGEPIPQALFDKVVAAESLIKFQDDGVPAASLLDQAWYPA